jgi:hypothetical protein
MDYQINIEPTQQDISYLIKRVPSELVNRTKVLESKVVVIPNNTVLNSNEYSYMSGTNDILEYMQKNLNNPNDISLLIEDYKGEIVAFSIEVLVGMFFVKDVIVPLFINLLSNHLYDRAKNYDEDTTFRVRFNIEITKNKDESKNISLDYKGSAENLKKVINEVKALLE